MNWQFLLINAIAFNKMSKKFKYIQAGDQSLDSLHDGRIQKFHYFKYENLQSSIISVWEPFCDFFCLYEKWDYFELPISMLYLLMQISDFRILKSQSKNILMSINISIFSDICYLDINIFGMIASIPWSLNTD